jgi:predicted O-methyltransferase YrrM
MLTCSAHNWRPDAISGAYQITDFPERNQRLASDCTSCPVTEEFGQRILTSTPALEAALQASEAAGLPSIQVPPSQGKLLQLLALAQGARRILEVGTLGGFSTLWLARALPADGHLVTLELEPGHAEVARGNFVRAGLADRIELHVGPALDTLAHLRAERVAPFRLRFYRRRQAQ